jgi:hypothetical protein
MRFRGGSLFRASERGEIMRSTAICAAFPAIVAGNDYPETMSYKHSIDLVDFMRWLPRHGAA